MSKLRSFTIIIEDEMLNKWRSEEYDPSYEFTMESSEGLSIEDVISTIY